MRKFRCLTGRANVLRRLARSSHMEAFWKQALQNRMEFDPRSAVRRARCGRWRTRVLDVVIDADTVVVSIEAVVADCERVKDSSDAAICSLLDFGDGVMVTMTVLTPALDGDGTAGLRTSDGVGTNDQSNGVCAGRHDHRLVERLACKT